MISIWIIIGFVIAIILIILSKLKEKKIKTIKREYQIQEGEIKYTDLDKPAKPLFSDKLKLVGKPDYVVKQDETYIPVELKKGHHSSPFQSHVMQLIAYCFLVEEEYKTKVPYGVLVYENFQIKIPFTEEKKQELLTTMQLMRTQKNLKRNHEQINKCLSCGFNYACEDKLK